MEALVELEKAEAAALGSASRKTPVSGILYRNGVDSEQQAGHPLRMISRQP